MHLNIFLIKSGGHYHKKRSSTLLFILGRLPLQKSFHLKGIGSLTTCLINTVLAAQYISPGLDRMTLGGVQATPPPLHQGRFIQPSVYVRLCMFAYLCALAQTLVLRLRLHRCQSVYGVLWRYPSAETYGSLTH